MQDLLYDILSVDTFTAYVIAGLVATIFWFIYEVVGSGILAAVFVPFLIVGGLAANYLFRVFSVPIEADKDSSVVVASAIGILCALALMILAVWIASIMKEHRVRNKRLTRDPLPPKA